MIKGSHINLDDDEEPERLDDEMPIFVVLDLDIHDCACCGKRNLKRTVRLDIPNGGSINLGVICAGKWFNINLTGNPWYAATRLANKLRGIDNTDVESIIEEIKEAAESWFKK